MSVVFTFSVDTFVSEDGSVPLFLFTVFPLEPLCRLLVTGGRLLYFILGRHWGDFCAFYSRLGLDQSLVVTRNLIVNVSFSP